ncbi:MAG: porin [Tabrizicola sp.]|nr:porin [Tabrizicola sp.]
MNRCALAALLIASAGHPAFALDFGNGFSVVGEVELEYADFDGADDTFFAGDVTISWRSNGGNGLGFGADFTVDTFRSLDEGGDLTAYWGGLVVTTGFGEATIGAPRPVLDTVYDFPEFGTNSAINREVGFLSGSAIGLLSLAADETPVGIGFRGSSGGIDYGISLHRMDIGANEITSTEIAARYTIGSTVFMGGLEIVDASAGSDLTNALFGMVYKANQLTLGLELTNRDAGGSASTARIHAGYDIGDALTVTGDYLQIDSDINTDLFSLGAEYRIGQTGFVEAGVTSGNSTDVIDIGVGFKF